MVINEIIWFQSSYALDLNSEAFDGFGKKAKLYWKHFRVKNIASCEENLIKLHAQSHYIMFKADCA